jgi:hypothetical protein
VTNYLLLTTIDWAIANRTIYTLEIQMKDTQYEQLFTELTSAEAEILEGGVLVFSSTVNFDRSLLSRTLLFQMVTMFAWGKC